MSNGTAQWERAMQSDLQAEMQRLTEENARLRLTAERDGFERDADELRDVLIRNGFVRCDIAACNCGSWHARYGLPERMAEIADALSEAGHPLTNENGHLALRALQELAAERNALRAEVQRLTKECGEKDAERYRVLRRKVAIIAEPRFVGRSQDEHGVFVFVNLPFPTYIAPDAAVELDAAIDAAMAAQPGGER